MRSVWVVLVLAGVGCGRAPLTDAGVAAPEDASTSGPLSDAGFSVWLAASADEAAVHLTWDAGPSSDAWVVLRDGVEVTRLPASERAFDDFGAHPGGLSTFEASATIDLADGIELEWSAPVGVPGAAHSYAVLTASGEGSNVVSAGRSAPTLLGFTVERGDAGWSFDAGVSLWLDRDAEGPAVFVASLSAAARANDETSSVVLEASADAGRVLEPVEYRLVARPSTGRSAELLVIGSRGGQRVEYQWQRSTDDSTSAFVDLPFVHGLTWLDQDAVLGQGRYYRVAARLPGQEWLSAPVRAELRAPVQLVGNGNGRNSFLLRDDGVSLSLRYPRPPVQFPPLLSFFAFRNLACGLLHDGGIECDAGDGGLASLNLPAALSAKANDEFLWLGLIDGGVDGYGLGSNGEIQFRRRAALLDASRVIAMSDDAVCGSRSDGGVRCSFGLSGTAYEPTVEVASGGAGLWMARQTLTVSDDRGQTTNFSRLGVAAGRLPVEDAGYVTGCHNLSECGVRADGVVRCLGGESRIFEPPVGAERYVAIETEQQGRCGLTTDRRVRCFARGLPHVPPAPPVRQIQVQGGELVALLGDGLVDARGLVVAVSLKESGDDRFVALSRDWRGMNHPQSVPQCGLRADGVALCGGNDVVPSGSRYRQITSLAGLLVDGGVESWVGDAGPAWPGVPVVELSEQPEASITCARFLDGGWSCFPAAVLPAEPLASISLSSAASGCGLTGRGQLRCWPDPPPAFMQRHRFRHVYATPSNLCGTTLEGEVLCVSADGLVLPPLRWDDFVSFEQSSSQGCGIRRDRTVACRNELLWGGPPWAP